MRTLPVHRAPLFTVAVLAVLASASCGNLGPTLPTRPSADISGTYTLVSARGQPLPATVSQNAASGFLQEVTGGAIVLGGDRRFTWRTDYRYTERGTVRVQSSSGGGAYELRGTRLTLAVEPGGERLIASLVEGEITLQADVVLVYRLGR